MANPSHYRAQNSALEVPASIRSTGLELARILRWLPHDYGEYLRERLVLPRAEQRGWHSMLCDLCATAPIPGYLRVASDLWKLAGAHSERVWNDHSAAVLACFQFAEIDGERYLYHPSLLRTIATQVEKIHKRSPKSEDFTGPPFSTGGEQLPLLLFSVLQGKKEVQRKSVGGGVRENFDERLERIRRARDQAG